MPTSKPQPKKAPKMELKPPPEPVKPKVAFYTPVKNEAQHAQRWTTEGAKEADYLFWLDTGSTDDTPKHAERAGITVVQAHFDPFRFDDARNTALALLPDDVTHCLHVDADEVVKPGWREEFEAHATHKRFRYALRNPAGEGWGQVIRANFHARHGYRWKGQVHEVVMGPEPTHMLETLVIEHHPNWEKPRSQYIDIMRRSVKEDTHDARMVFYLGRELWHKGEWEEARRVLMQYIGMPEATWDVERQDAIRYIAKMDYHPERWLLRAIAEAPHRREPYVDLCRLYLAQQRMDEARGMYAAAERLTDETLYTTDPTAWGESFEALGKEVR